jgi:hypothetical protein
VGATVPAGTLQAPCDAGSRWHNYVFHEGDLYLPLTLTKNSEIFEIRIDGVRTCTHAEWNDEEEAHVIKTVIPTW